MSTSLEEFMNRENEPVSEAAPKPSGENKKAVLKPSEQLLILRKEVFDVFNKYFARTGKCLCQDGGTKPKTCFCALPDAIELVKRALMERGA